jgi:hypothetical protein
MYIPIHGACCKYVWVMGREIDVGYSSCVPMKCVFNSPLGSIFLHIQIPYQCLLICCTDYPVIPDCKWGPLHVCDQPRKSMSKVSRRVPGRVEVNNIKTVGTRRLLAMFFRTCKECARGQSNISARWRDGCRSDFAIDMNGDIFVKCAAVKGRLDRLSFSRLVHHLVQGVLASSGSYKVKAVALFEANCEFPSAWCDQPNISTPQLPRDHCSVKPAAENRL